MACPSCNGTGCEHCNDAGTIDITGCPVELVSNDVWSLIEYVKLWEKGIPPIAGGALDQAYCFIQAARFVFAEEQVWKRKLGIING